MTLGKTLLLGLIATVTIFLGLPVARIRKVSVTAKAALNAFAIGVLVFLLIETLHKSSDQVETALTNAHDHLGPWSSFAGKSVLFVGALLVGLVGLTAYEQWMRNKRSHLNTNANPAYTTALLIALGSGLHNFAEGLSIGQSAARNDVKLAVLLVVGFALHNATEAFGIAGPLTGEATVPTWRWLGLMGLIAGGPTFVGTAIGHSFVNNNLALLFLALAAGSILYVVIQLIGVALKMGRPMSLAWGVIAGLATGLGTDFILVVAGA